MKRADYICPNGHISEVYVQDTEEFPETSPCNACQSHSKRSYAPLPGHIMLGSCGNYSNGYKSTGGYIKKTK